MPSVAELLERAGRTVDLEGDHFERLIRRRDRKDRNRRIRAGVLALAVTLLATVVLLHAFPSGPAPADHTVQPSPTVDDSVLPPEGERASEPLTGRLVLRFESLTDGSDLAVYADGLVAWHPNQDRVGYLELRLSRSGVQRVRTMVLAQGPFEGDVLRLLSRDRAEKRLSVEVRFGGHAVRVEWGAPSFLVGGSNNPTATPSQERGLRRLKAFLVDPSAWQLPPELYVERDVRTFVPSLYLVAYDRSAPDLSQLSPAVREVLASHGRLLQHACVVMTTEEARALVRALVQSGFAPHDQSLGGASFKLPGPSFLHMHIALPDDSWC